MSTISFLAGLGAGYMDRQDKERDYARRDRLDQIALDRASRESEQYNQAQADRNALRAAGAPVPVIEQPTVLPETMDNRDVGQPGETTPAAPSFKVGTRQFASRGVADKAAQEQQQANVAAELNRQDPAGAGARQLQAAQLQAAMRHAQDEGTARALSAALSGMPAAQVEALYNQNGGDKVANLKIEPIESNHPVLGKRPSVRITGTDGNGQPFEIADANAVLFGMFTAQQQLDALSKKQEQDVKSKQFDRTATREEGAANALAEYHKALAAAAGVRADKAGSGKKDPLDRMTEADKQEYLGIREQIKTINGEITKARASDSWNGESANAKALMSTLAGLNMRGRALLDQYNDTTDAPDPAGIRKKPSDTAPAPSGKNPGTIDPSTQAARDAEGGRMIIRSELGNDPSRVAAEIARIDTALKTDKSAPAEARNMLTQRRGMLTAGAASMAGQPPAPAAMAARGVQPPAAGPAPVVAAPAQTIPDPPPQAIQQGLRMVPNPAFVDWERQFGPAWREQQAKAAANGEAAAAAARTSYNPYQQNRVR